MAIWTKLVREYFRNNDKGTAIDILKWIHDNKEQEVRDYIQQEIDRVIIKEPWIGLPWGGVDKRYRQLMKVETISSVLNRMFKKGELDRKENIGKVKWIYFVPKKERKRHEKNKSKRS